jgi:tripartite-type tricarboxylate transporter receptor subunit TctC
MAALVAHDTDMYFGNASELISQAEGGRIRMLAVSTEKPMKQLPGLPPVASVYPGFKTSSWNGFLVASGTPQDIVTRLESEIRAAVQDPTIRSRLEALGIEPVGNSAAEFAAVIDADRPFYQEAIEAAGLKRAE